MRRGHRKAHLVIWPLLASALAIAVAAALILRPPPEPEPGAQSVHLETRT